jgi:hypothetical protein
MRARKHWTGNGVICKLQLRGAFGGLDFESILAGLQAFQARHASPCGLARTKRFRNVLIVQRGAEFFWRRVGFDQSIAASYHVGAAGKHTDFDGTRSRKGVRNQSNAERSCRQPESVQSRHEGPSIYSSSFFSISVLVPERLGLDRAGGLIR